MFTLVAVIVFIWLRSKKQTRFPKVGYGLCSVYEAIDNPWYIITVTLTIHGVTIKSWIIIYKPYPRFGNLATVNGRTFIVSDDNRKMRLANI